MVTLGGYAPASAAAPAAGAAPSRPWSPQALSDLRAQGVPVETGRFRAHMDVELVNSGPVTLVISSPARATA